MVSSYAGYICNLCGKIILNSNPGIEIALHEKMSYITSVIHSSLYYHTDCFESCAGKEFVPDKYAAKSKVPEPPEPPPVKYYSW